VPFESDPFIPGLRDGSLSVVELSQDDPDADGVGDESAVGRVLAPVPIRFHPVVPLRDPLEKMLFGKGALAFPEQYVEGPRGEPADRRLVAAADRPCLVLQSRTIAADVLMNYAG